MIGSLLLLGVLSAGASQAGPRPVVEHDYAIVLDAGHGGSNSGCTSPHGDTDEKAVSLALAQDVRIALRERLPHAKVLMTREQDRTLALADRVALANAQHADVFVSLHANASARHDQRGFETYVLDADASSREAAWTARRENDGELADDLLVKAAPAEAMLAELLATSQRTSAVALAQSIQRAQAQRFPRRSDRGVRQGSFDVLVGVRMPAVLFEAAFLDDASESELLLDDDQRMLIAEGIADALVEHYRRTQRVTPTGHAEASR
jgi:N-acetylmuramoyl-L-alanine amidase